MSKSKFTTTIAVMTIIALSGASTYAANGVRAEIKTEREAMHAENKGKIEAMRTENKTGRTEMNKEIKAGNEAMRVDVKAMKDAGATPEQIKAKVEEARKANEAERQAYRQKLDDKRKVLKTEIEKSVATFKEGKKVKLDAAKKTSVQKILDGAFKKFGEAINKLANFDTKVSVAIANRNSKGLDTGAAVTAQAEARVALDQAKVAIEAANSALKTVVAGDTATSKEAIKSVMETAKTAIKTAGEKYKAVISVLPDISAKVEAVK
jgi:hypothetical protein